MLLFILKLTAFLLAGYIALLSARRTSAALRHLLCLGILSGSLLIPLGTLLPARALSVNTVLIDRVVARSIPIAHGGTYTWPSILLAAWMIVSALLILRLVAAYWHLSRLRRHARPLDTRVFAADVTVPVAAGIFSPAILVPPDFTNWPESQQDAAIRHETAHILRKDLWANLISNVACSLYWFHPLIWLLNFLLRAEQETACDEAVITTGFSRVDYAEALVAVARNSAGRFAAGCAMTTKADLKSRVTKILDSKLVSISTRQRIAIGGIVATLALAALIPLRAETVYTVADGITPPSVTYRVEPQYTEEARKNRIMGSVILTCIIRSDGMAHDCNVKQGLDSGLDANAALAVEQWRFAPGTRNGEPVSVAATIEINFRLL